MTFTLGFTQLIYLAIIVAWIISLFVAAQYGKRIGMRGGSVRSQLTKDIDAIRAKALIEIKEAKEKHVKAKAEGSLL